MQDRQVNTQLSTLNPQLSTVNPQFSSLHPQLSTLNPQPSTLNTHPSTFNPQPSLLSPQLSTLNSRLSTLNPQPLTLNPQPSTLCSQSSTLDPQLSTFNPQTSFMEAVMILRMLSMYSSQNSHGESLRRPCTGPQSLFHLSFHFPHSRSIRPYCCTTHSVSREKTRHISLENRLGTSHTKMTSSLMQPGPGSPS